MKENKDNKEDNIDNDNPLKMKQQIILYIIIIL